MIDKQQLQPLLEPFIYDKLEDKEYEIIKINPKKLLTWNRFIIAFNLFYLKYRDVNSRLSKEIYKEMIRGTSLGSYIEPGQEDTKNSLDKFYEAFDNTFNSIKKYGFDQTKTLIPLANDGSILNGSHRVASALILKKDIFCIQTSQEPLVDDWKNLFERNIDISYIEIAVKEFIKFSDENIYISFLWPSCKNKHNKNRSIFDKVVYEKDIKLTSNGVYNLLIELYKHMDDWVGTPENKYNGIQQKLLECFPDNDYKIKVIIFQSDSLEKVQKIKAQARNNCNIGYSSIHITDTKEEAIRISEFILNENGIHFLNYADILKYNDLNNVNIDKIKIFIEKNNIDFNNFIVDSSMVLALYGLRKNVDIDYLEYHDSELEYHDSELEYHDSELEYHDSEKNELIFNPKNYFVYGGIKFISFGQLYKMKKNRNGEKDNNDISIMKALISNNIFDKYKSKLKQNIFYFKIKIKSFLHKFLLSLLKNIGLYKVVRNVYRKIKGNK